MKKPCSCIFALACLAAGPLLAQDVAGVWQGTIAAKGRDFRVVLKVARTAPDQSLGAQFFSIDQGGDPLPVTSIKVNGPSVTFRVDVIAGSFEGTLNREANAIGGTWTQGPAPVPLTLTRATPETAWTIPEAAATPRAMDPSAHPSFEVATIKPSRPDAQGRGFTMRGGQVLATNVTLMNLISMAFDLHERQVVNGPAWIESEKFDVTGKPDIAGQPNVGQLKQMFQKLLADRFALRYHYDRKELSVFAIVPLPNAAHKLTPNESGRNLPSLPIPRLGLMPVRNATMDDFALSLQGAVLDRPVVNLTGIQGRYDFTLDWTPDESQFASLGGVRPDQIPDDGKPNIFRAFQEQLGLKLEATKAPARVMVIDKADKPSDN